jgi:large subunit ribosomal protein L13
VEKTYVIKGKTESKWCLVDAKDQKLGRLASKIATLLMGKHKPEYTPGVLMGDSVIVINAKEIKVNPTREKEKIYYRHSGYPGGLKAVTFPDQLENHPDRVIKSAVWGMLPHNKHGRHLLKRLKIYGGQEHPHAGQNPEVVEIK